MTRHLAGGLALALGLAVVVEPVGGAEQAELERSSTEAGSRSGEIPNCYQCSSEVVGYNPEMQWDLWDAWYDDPCETGEEEGCAFCSEVEDREVETSEAESPDSATSGGCREKTDMPFDPCGVQCFPGQELKAVVALIAGSDVAGLRQLLAAPETRFSYNAGRLALQATDCGGRVAIHLPLDPAVANDLTATGAGD